MKLQLIAVGFAALSMAFATPALEADLGVDFANRYVWRGIDFGESPSIQPSVVLGFGGLEIGAWGAYATNDEKGSSNELDTWIGFSHEISDGHEIGVAVTDYYYPNAGMRIGDFDGDGKGAHTIEASIGYTGMLNLFAAVNVHNDKKNAVYLRLGKDLAFGDVVVEPFVSGTTSESTWYATSGAAFLEVGLSASKDIAVTKDFALPISATFLVNPNTNKSHLVFTVSL